MKIVVLITERVQCVVVAKVIDKWQLRELTDSAVGMNIIF
jgi:hypothetical protein